MGLDNVRLLLVSSIECNIDVSSSLSWIFPGRFKIAIFHVGCHLIFRKYVRFQYTYYHLSAALVPILFLQDFLFYYRLIYFCVTLRLRLRRTNLPFIRPSSAYIASRIYFSVLFYVTFLNISPICVLKHTLISNSMNNLFFIYPFETLRHILFPNWIFFAPPPPSQPRSP